MIGKSSVSTTTFGGKYFRAFRTLIITPSKERLQHMREAATRLPFSHSQAKRFLWITTDEKLTRQTLFDPIWLSLDANDTSPHKIG
jgi:hypothetical protein